jgi:hypothetical protein
MFLAEAKRLLELERNNPSITTVQGAGIISLTCVVDGVDELGIQYLRQALELAQRIDLFNPASFSVGPSHTAAVTTTWDLFNWQR